VTLPSNVLDVESAISVADRLLGPWLIEVAIEASAP